MTQFEMTTSTDVGRKRDLLDQPLQEVDVRGSGLARVLLREREHLVRHVEAVRHAGRSDSLCREDDVDSAARAEVEHDLALAQIGNGGRVAAAKGGERRSIRELAALLGAVERFAEAGLVGAAGAAPAALLARPRAAACAASA